MYMNKKETLEIRKQFTNENCAITRICGCYVDAEKQVRTELKEAFLALPEEEIFKYYEIFHGPVAEETLHKANMNDIVVAATDEPAFELIGKMYALGVGKK